MRKFNTILTAVLLAASVFAPNLLAGEDRDDLKTVYDSLEMTQADKDMTAKLHDDTEGFQENAFYWMMKKVASLPQLVPSDFARLDSPSYQNMLRSPERYRFLPVRMSVRVYTVQTLTREKYYLINSPFWNADKPIYRIFATNAAAGKMHEEEPLMIFCDKLPPNLPDKFKQADHDVREYKSGPTYEMAGIFSNTPKTPAVTATSGNIPCFWRGSSPTKVPTPRTVSYPRWSRPSAF